MAVAQFHSVRGQEGKSALLLVKSNPLEYSMSPCYVPVAGVAHFAGKPATELNQGDTFEIPDGFQLVDIVDIETGEVRTAKDGSPLKQLKY